MFSNRLQPTKSPYRRNSLQLQEHDFTAAPSPLAAGECGLLAGAFATSICNGEESRRVRAPSTCRRSTRSGPWAVAGKRVPRSTEAGPSHRRRHRVSPSRLSRFLPSVVLVLSAALAGCSSMPSLPERAASTAVTDTTGTALGQLAAASLEQAGPGHSGVRLLSEAAFALDARIALGTPRRPGRSTCSTTCWQNDDVGHRLLREAARRGRTRGAGAADRGRPLQRQRRRTLNPTLRRYPGVEVRLFNPLPWGAAARADLSRVVCVRCTNSAVSTTACTTSCSSPTTSFSVSGGRNVAQEYFMRSGQCQLHRHGRAGPPARRCASSRPALSTPTGTVRRSTRSHPGRAARASTLLRRRG